MWDSTPILDMLTVAFFTQDRAPDLGQYDWCTGKCLRTSSLVKTQGHGLILVVANFHSVNTFTRSDFKLKIRTN
jgi:hypothetical protein